MTQIKVRPLDEAESYEVTVIDSDESSTRHFVTFSEQSFSKLSHQDQSPEECLKAAFLFLLDRESKEMILARFEFNVIKQYFPEFDHHFKNYLKKV